MNTVRFSRRFPRLILCAEYAGACHVGVGFGSMAPWMRKKTSRPHNVLRKNEDYDKAFRSI